MNQFLALVKDSYDNAVHSGLKDVSISFDPELDYDGLSEVILVVRGEQELSPQELAVRREQDALQLKANKLGVTFYEASVVEKLRAKGLVDYTTKGKENVG